MLEMIDVLSCQEYMRAVVIELCFPFRLSDQWWEMKAILLFYLSFVSLQLQQLSRYILIY